MISVLLRLVTPIFFIFAWKGHGVDELLRKIIPCVTIVRFAQGTFAHLINAKVADIMPSYIQY